MNGQDTSTDRGQAFTLESIFASLLLLAAVLFVLETTALTPLTGSTSNAQIQKQQSAIAEGVLESAIDRGYLKDAALHWDPNNETWAGLDSNEETYATPSEMQLAFGEQLEQSFLQWGVAVNVEVQYRAPDGATDQIVTREMVDMGAPSTNSITSQRTIILYDQDRLRDAQGNETGQTLSGTSSRFYAQDVKSGSDVYNIVTIKVEAWRI